MNKNVVAIAFHENIIRNLKKKIEDLSNDIVYVETVLKNEKNKRIHEIILKNLDKKKKKNYEECQKFYETYTQFLLKKNKVSDKNTFPPVSLQQEKENHETALSETASTCSTSATEDEKYKVLEDLYNKKKKLTKVLDIIEKKDTYDILTNDSVEKIEELDKALQIITESYTDCKIFPYDIYKSSNEYKMKAKSKKKGKDDENIKELNNKKSNYLHNNFNNFNNNNNSNNIFHTGNVLINNENDRSLFNGKITDSSLWLDKLKNKYLNKKKGKTKNNGANSNAIICKVMKIINGKEKDIKQEKSKALNSYLDNTVHNFFKDSETDKKKNYIFSLKDMEKHFSKKENVKQFIMENSKLNKKSMISNKINTDKQHITFASDIVGKSSINSVIPTPFNFLDSQIKKTYLNKINSKANILSKRANQDDSRKKTSKNENHKMSENCSANNSLYKSFIKSSYKSHSPFNTSSKRNSEKDSHYSSNDVSDSSSMNQDHSNSSSNSNNSSSSNSSSSSNNDESSFYSDIGDKLNHLGRKKHIITFNKDGKGKSYIKKKKGSSETYIYDIEIRYDNSDANKKRHGKYNINKDKTKKQRILKLSFLKNKSNIFRVKHLSVLKKSQIKNLPFYDTITTTITTANNNKNNNANINTTESIEKIEKKENSKSNIKECLEQTKEERVLRRELSDIINTINNTYNNELKQLYGAPYMIDTIDTNKLRGIYLQLIERQRELENERNFYKNELDMLNKSLINASHLKKNSNVDDAGVKVMEIIQKMLQENVFNVSNNLAKSNDSDKCKEREKEKEYLLKEKEMEKNVFQLEFELKMCKEQLEKEKATNVNLQKITETNKLTMINAERLLLTNEKNNEDLLTLHRRCEELKTSVEAEKQKNSNLTDKVNFQLNIINNMQNELDTLKKNTSFDNFRKSVLMKVNNANDEMKELIRQIEILTEELEIKLAKEKELRELLHKSNEKCISKNDKLKICKKKLKRDTILINHMRQEIDYLNVKIENLLESVEYLKEKIETYTSSEKKEADKSNCNIFLEENNVLL